MRNKLSNALWGLFLIIVGLGFAGDVMDLWNFELFFKGWWTFLIIVPCFISMVQNGFSVAPTIGFIIGVMLFVNYRVDLNFDMGRLIVPAVLILIGIRIMLQGSFRKKHKFFDQNINNNINNNPNPGQPFTGANRAEYSAVFSSNRIHVTDNFTGTNVNAIFGGLVLDLRDAQITSDVEVNATAVFGGIDIFVPRGVKIKTNNVPIFGGVSNKTSQSAEPNAPTIYLNATCMFGGIDIK